MRASGRVYIRKRKRADQWYAQYRVGDRRFNRRLGPVWTERGRPPEGYFTKRKAKAALDAILTDARRGELSVADPEATRTYGDACAEFLRYVEHEKDRSPSTVRDYTNAIRRRLLPEFGESTALSSITTERIDAYRERLLAEGKLSRRSVRSSSSSTTGSSSAPNGESGSLRILRRTQSGSRSRAVGTSTCSVQRRFWRSPGLPTTSRTQRFSSWRHSQASGWGSYGPCAGQTLTLRTAPYSSARTGFARGWRSRRAARSGLCPWWIRQQQRSTGSAVVGTSPRPATSCSSARPAAT